VRSHDGFGRDTHRYLDGEPHGELPDGERARADRLADAARALGDALPTLEAGLDERIMAAVRRAAAPRRGAWRWLVEPQAVRIRPVVVPLAAAAVLALLWVAAPRRGGAPGQAVATAAAAASPTHDTVYVRFELADADARAVAVAGSFNGWRAEALPMRRGAGGVWSVTVPLPLGEYQYQFVVDGVRWVSDPTAHVLEDDGFGGRNSVIVVGAKGVVRS
jgi:hypothetical protein